MGKASKKKKKFIREGQADKSGILRSSKDSIKSAKPTDTSVTRASFLKCWPWIVIAVIIAFVAVIRIRLLQIPLERDEGEYAYMGQLILQGIPPYSEAYNMKFPGTYAMYALIMSIFGQNIQGIHSGFMIVNCAAILLVFLLARKLVSETAALTASAAYALLSLSPSVLGFAAHATHFVVVPALGGVLVLLLALRNNKSPLYCLSGALFGLAALMKQPGLFFFLFGFSYIVFAHFFSVSARYIKKLLVTLGMFTIGGAAPLIIAVIYLYTVGAFDKFWFWTVEYASKYGSQLPVSAAFDIFRTNVSEVVDGLSFLWIMAVFGFIGVFFHQGLKGKRVFTALFTLFSFLTMCPGFYFRPHYFVTLLPVVAILIGIFVEWLNVRVVALFKTRHLRFIGIVIFILATGTGIASQRAYLFKEDPAKLSRTVYGTNPFPESIEIAKFIESQSLPTDSVAVFGSEPQIFFYSRRHSATGYIYVYGLMEKHDYSLTMQQEMIREVMSSNPKFIVVVHIATSWLMRPESEKYIFGWMNNYVRQNYVLVGVADIISPDLTVYKWYADTANYKVLSPAYLLLYERR